MAELPKYFYFRVTPVTQKGVLDQIMVEDASDVDVVEVVRCKDCAFWNREDEQPNGCLCEHWSGAAALWYTPHDGFCSDGLRRPDNA